MSDIIADNDDDELTPAQEYAIAGGVILLFGLLYWVLNHGWSLPDDASARVAPPSAQLAVSGQHQPALEVATVATEVSTPASSHVATTSTPAPAVSQMAVTQEPIPASASVSVPAAGAASEIPAKPVAMPDTGPVGPASPAATVPEAAVAAPVQTPPAAPVPPAADSALPPLSYQFPDGKAVTVGSSGFEGAFRQVIANRAVNQPVVFDNIQFDKGSTAITASSDQQIRATAALLQTYPDIRVLVRGHTDETGIPGSNTELSLMRANEVGVALVNLGVDRRRLRTMGMGDTSPIDTNTTEEGRKHNRRVDVMILP